MPLRVRSLGVGVKDGIAFSFSFLLKGYSLAVLVIRFNFSPVL